MLRFAGDSINELLIKAIAARAWRDLQAARHHDKFTEMDVEMDVSATHASGCPLRLRDLLNADQFNFAHDILGIRRHLNRETGRLEDCFRPRYSRSFEEKTRSRAGGSR